MRLSFTSYENQGPSASEKTEPLDHLDIEMEPAQPLHEVDKKRMTFLIA